MFAQSRLSSYVVQKTGMRIENQHKYRLRWWIILAAAGTFTIAIDSALDERWSTTVVDHGDVYLQFILVVDHAPLRKFQQANSC
jgi:hypothetical protein